MSDTEEMDELRGYVEDGLLSKIQVEILESKLKGAKYTEIEKFYDLSGPVALSHCLRLTAQQQFSKALTRCRHVTPRSSRRDLARRAAVG